MPAFAGMTLGVFGKAWAAFCLAPAAVRQSVSLLRQETAQCPTSASCRFDEINDRIAITRDNIRQLIEQAAAMSGAGDEARNADRLAAQQAELEALIKERDERGKSRQ